MDRQTCAETSLAADEPLLGTASRVSRYLLVEQPGPWGAEAVRQSGLATDLAEDLAARAAAADARLLLIRRPFGATSPRRHLLAADSSQGSERLLVRTEEWTADLREVALPWEPAPADDGGSGWSPYPDPVFLACTNGRRDLCCAERGRPLATALAAVEPAGTWECSHLGGHRFAATAAVLPAGLFLGRVDPAEAGELVDSVRAGRLPLPWLRGRSSLNPPAQAAQALAARLLGLLALSDLPVLGEEAVDGGWRIRMGTADGAVEAVVRRAPSRGRVLPSCGAEEEDEVEPFELVGLA